MEKTRQLRDVHIEAITYVNSIIVAGVLRCVDNTKN
jgi:hypothetical protein